MAMTTGYGPLGRHNQRNGDGLVGGTRFDRVAAGVAILGAIAVIVANLVGAWMHPSTGLVADTISNLAAGRYHWVLDAALVIYGVGMGMIALALWDFDLGSDVPGGWHWRTGAALIGLVGIAVAVIALWNEYGDGVPGGVTIHLEVVIAMGIAFTLGTVLLSLGLVRLGRGWSAFSLWSGILWLIFGIAFFYFVPDGWDGLVERIAAGIMVVWSLGMARLIGRQRSLRM